MPTKQHITPPGMRRELVARQQKAFEKYQESGVTCYGYGSRPETEIAWLKVWGEPVPDDLTNHYPDSTWGLMTFEGGSLECQAPEDCARWTVRVAPLTNAEIAQLDPACASGLTCPPLLDTNGNGIRDTVATTDVATLFSDNANDEGDYRMPFEMRVTVLPQEDGGGKGGPKK